MTKLPKPASPPTAIRRDSGAQKDTGKIRTARQHFLMAVLNMSWQLVIVVLVPIIGGAELDRRGGGKHFWVFIGLAVAFVAATLVMWQAVRLAGRLPVPKLTAAQKRAIQKQYEEDDE